MASSPYRFTIQNDAPEQAPRSRVGLSSITSGGGSAGGEGYRASALRPGSSGWMAATFGGAPRTDYVRPTTTATVTATPTATQTAAPTLVPEYNAGWTGAEGAGAGGGQTGGPTGFDAGGQPGDLGDIGIDIDGKMVGGFLGGALGGLALGPLGGLAGAVAGRALGGSISGPAAPQPTAQVTAQPTAPGVPGAGDDGMADGLGPTGNEQMGHDANAAAGNENASAQASADTADAEAAAGDPGAKYAAGGPVNRLMKDMPMDNKPKGLSQVQNFGGYADGGGVPMNPQRRTDMAQAYIEARMPSLPLRVAAPSSSETARLNANNTIAGAASEAIEAYPGVWGLGSSPVHDLLRNRPDLVQALIEQRGSIHPVNPANPSTGYMGAYAGGGRVGMSGDDVNAALWLRAKRQAAPTPEMIQAQRVANAPTEMRRGGMRFAENNAQADATINANYGTDPQFRPETHYLGDMTYVTGQGQGMDDPLNYYYAQQRLRDAVNSNTQMIEGAPLGPDHRLFTPRVMRQPRFMGAYAGGGQVPNYADGGPVDGAGLAGPDPAGPDDGFAALDGGEYVVQAQQAQRPDYASVLEQINQGTYNPAGEGMGESMDGATTDGTMPAEGSAGADPSSLPPMMQQALGQAVAADPMLAQALTSLLGPEAVNELMACCGGGVGMAPQGGEHETPFGRPPLAGPKPPPGINSPPGVRPPAAASPTMPMPPPMGGLRGIAA